MTNCDYVLVTPARNEEAFIGRTIESVRAQTILPKKWIIISDGSTDSTDRIVAEVARQHEFITLVRSESGGRRSFSSKANAFTLSREHLKDIDFAYIGNLDADVSFSPDYYERVLQRLETYPGLGIAGGLIYELIEGRFVGQRTSLNSVAGAVQLFRKQCYDEIGGYAALRYGGIDSAAEMTARMRGWEVRTFIDLEVLHHRRVSSGETGLVKTKLRHGMRHYSLGYHPVFEHLRCVGRMFDRPYVIGSLLMAAGYLWAWALKQPRELSPDVIAYVRNEQLQRLRSMFLRRPAVSAQRDGRVQL